jgi:hypothetical protein
MRMTPLGTKPIVQPIGDARGHPLERRASENPIVKGDGWCDCEGYEMDEH